jgi:hypothetical protein
LGQIFFLLPPQTPAGLCKNPWLLFWLWRYRCQQKNGAYLRFAKDRDIKSFSAAEKTGVAESE